MKVLWTVTAERHLDLIFQYIAQESPQYAVLIVDTLTRRSQQLALFPLMGRKVPEYNSDQIRELIEYPYRIIYRILKDQIHILAVIHGARNPKELAITIDQTDEQFSYCGI